LEKLDIEPQDLIKK